MSSTFTSGAAIEFLDVASLLNHVVIVDGYRNNTLTVKDRQVTNYAPKDRSATED